jgi:hypothetical protein
MKPSERIEIAKAIANKREIPNPPEGEEHCCKNCCFQGEPFTYDWRCNICILQPIKDREEVQYYPYMTKAGIRELDKARTIRWQPTWKKWDYFDSR